MSTTTRTRTPEVSAAHGGVFLPMYQANSLWIDFDASYPMEVKVAVGKVDALTVDAWKNLFSNRGHISDYLAAPRSFPGSTVSAS